MGSKKKTNKQVKKGRSITMEPPRNTISEDANDPSIGNMWHDFCVNDAVPIKTLTRLLLASAVMAAAWFVADWLDPVALEDIVDISDEGRLLWSYPGVQAQDFLWAGLALMFGMGASAAVFGKNAQTDHIKTVAFCGTMAFSLKSLPPEGSGFNSLGIEWVDYLFYHADIICAIMLCTLVAACVASSLAGSQRTDGASWTITIVVGIIATVLMFMLCLDAEAFALFLLYTTFAVVAYLLAQPLKA